MRQQPSELDFLPDVLVVTGVGRTVQRGSVEDFVAEHARRGVRVRSPQIVAIGDALRADGATVTMVDDTAADVVGPTAAAIGELAARSGAVLHELSPQQGSLEEAFLEA